MAYEQIKIMDYETGNNKPVGSLRGAILKNDSNERFLQLKLINNSSQYLKEFTVKIICLDANNQELGTQEYTYNAMFVAPGEIFGTNTAIPLKYQETSSVKLEFKNKFDSIKVKSKLIKHKKINFEYLPLIVGIIAVASGILYFFTRNINYRGDIYVGYNIISSICYIISYMPKYLLIFMSAFPVLYTICKRNKVENKWLNNLTLYYVLGGILYFLYGFIRYIKSLSGHYGYYRSRYDWILITIIVIFVIYQIYKQFEDDKKQVMIIIGLFVAGFIIDIVGIFNYVALMIDAAFIALCFNKLVRKDFVIICVALAVKNLYFVFDNMIQIGSYTIYQLKMSLIPVLSVILFLIAVAGVVILYKTNNEEVEVK